MSKSKKTYYYEFMDEKKGAASSRSVVEIRDDETLDTNNNNNNKPRFITKTVTTDMINSGEVVLSHEEVLDSIFHYWKEDVCNNIEKGHKYAVTIESGFYEYRNENLFIQKKNDREYVIGCMDVIRRRDLRVDDRIKLICERGSTKITLVLLAKP